MFQEFSLLLDGPTVKADINVKLLGLTLDQHLTMTDHIEATVRKCHGLLGILARAAKELPRPLLRLAYIVLIRSHLEYGSAVIATAASTHLKKIDVIHRMAARIIFDLPRDAHSSPLLEVLQLKDLSKRRKNHIVQIVSP